MTRIRTLFAGLCIAIPQTGQAQFTDLFCDDTTRLHDQLQTVNGATPQASGIRDPDAMIQIWIVPSSGDWTIVQNYANGTSCVLAMGEYWENYGQEPV
ncbi:hypothetical protein [Yoonia sp. BS5-3]|uniref:Uncharacterized protein n=1 Tax=Yoonia phaeophyticola TaxID=3137369 RepID=A0ABZ2VAE6_9RHOB